MLAEIGGASGDYAARLPKAALALPRRAELAGNLAELRGAVSRVAGRLRRAGLIQIERIVPALQLKNTAAPFARIGCCDARLRFECVYIAAVLQHHGWRVNEAAQNAQNIQRPNLHPKARQLGIPMAALLHRSIYDDIAHSTHPRGAPGCGARLRAPMPKPSS